MRLRGGGFAWLALASAAVAAPAGQNTGEAVAWRSDVEAARAEAARLARPILVVFR